MAGPESTERTELVIIGGGIAGAAAALRTAQNHLPSFWVLGDTRTHKASRSAYVRNVDNMVGVHPDIVRSKAVALLEKDFPDAAARLREAHLHISTEDLVENVHQRIAEEFGQVVQEVGERAETLDRSQDEFCVKTTSGRLLAAPAVILATGVSDRQPVIHRQKGEKILGHNRLVSRDLETGDVRWEIEFDDVKFRYYAHRGADTRLVYDGKRTQLFVRAMNHIKAVDARTGRLRYKIALTNQYQNMSPIRPIIAGDDLYLPYRMDLEKRDPWTGKLVKSWRYTNTFRCQHAKIADDKLIYGYDGHFDIATGEAFVNRTLKAQCRGGFHVSHGKKITPRSGTTKVSNVFVILIGWNSHQSKKAILGAPARSEANKQQPIGSPPTD